MATHLLMDDNHLLELKLQLEGLLDSVQNFSNNSRSWMTPIILPEADDKDTDDIPGLRLFATAVRREIETLEKVFVNAEETPTALSTNAPYYLAVWNEVVRAPTPILAIGKSFALPKERGVAKPSLKVDVVADDGRLWIRVNTTKNSRLMAELRESDSYLDDDSAGDSSKEDDVDQAFAPLQPSEDLDNSLLRVGRALVDAASHNTLPGTVDPPRITMRLTRLDIAPSAELDPRIPETVHILELMGITVELGEPTSPIRAADDPSDPSLSDTNTLIPTNRINLDLSLLIALVSDLTHAPLPSSAAEATARFRPLVRKRKERPMATSDDETDAGEHSRALVGQLQQEMSRYLLDEIRARVEQPAALVRPSGEVESEGPIEFWTTQEAMDRCLSIIDKIGGTAEKRRATSLFATEDDLTDNVHLLAFWEGSRYPPNHLPGIPVHVYPENSPEPAAGLIYSDPFQARLICMCGTILASSPAPDAISPSDPVKPIISRGLTAHTVRSLLKGAMEGITTLTANKASVKAILREMRSLDGGAALLLSGVSGPRVNIRSGPEKGRRSGERTAWIWVVEPRSLAENMRADVS